jgi:predicted permease
MDLRIGLRSLRKSPGFTLLAVTVLALGIGANTAIFSVVNAVLLRPLSYRDPDRIVTLTTAWTNGPFQKDAIARQVSATDFQDWRDQSTVFDAAALIDAEMTSVGLGASAEYARAAQVSPEFFRAFQIEPMLGSISPQTAAISYAFWQTHFGGAANVLGQTIRVFGRTVPIGGVLGPGFAFPTGTGVWLSTDPPARDDRTRGGLNFQAIALLKPGVSLPQAQAQMTSIAAYLEQQYPDTNKNRTVAVTRLRDDMVSGVRTTLYLLLGATGVILLIACANTATLLLARASGRTREIAIRCSVGASRMRIVRQLLAESLLLAALGGGLGLILAGWGSAALVSLAPADVPRLTETSIDRWVMAFTVAASVIATLLAGLAPALQASRVDLNEALKQSTSRSSASGKMGRLRAALVIAEVALSVMLVCGAGLLIKSFLALNSVELGFQPANVLLMRTTVPLPVERAHAFFRGLLAGVAALPGVIASGATMGPPGHVESSGAYWLNRIPERLDLSTGTPDVLSVVAPGTFRALGIPLVSGRDFNDADGENAPFVAIVNESVARKSFPSGDAVGSTIFCPFDSLKIQTLKIVGVVGDVRQYGPSRPPMPECFLPYQQHRYNGMTLSVVVRTTAEPKALAETLRRMVRERSSEVSVSFTTMEASLAENTATPRFRTLLLGMFAGLAMLLAMAGVYGVMSYLAGQRAPELGLRMALGAKPAQLATLMLRQTVALGAIGLVLGLAGAAATTRVLKGMLFEVQPNDPSIYAGVAFVLGIVVVAASFFPARRAAKADPLVALRQE